MSRENELLDPRTPEDESTPTAHDHESEAINGSHKETAPLKHTESDHPAERNTAHEPKKPATPAFTGERFDYTEGEYSNAPDEEVEHVDIYAEPAELYEDADEDEILDAEEEITEETVEEPSRRPLRRSRRISRRRRRSSPSRDPRRWSASSSTWRICWIPATTPTSATSWPS